MAAPDLGFEGQGDPSEPLRSELRFDPLSGASAIVAPHRRGRPSDRERTKAPPRPPRLPRQDPDCPFCPSGSSVGAAPILVLPDLAGGGWRARIVANAFPALSAHPGDRGGGEAPPALGRHEVIIESPRHDHDLPDMSPAEVRGVVEITLARMRQLARDPGIAALFVFRNHGASAGSSLLHPHGQIMALPFVPGETARREAHLAAQHDAGGRNPFTATIEAERAEGRRIVIENGEFAAYVPFAPEASCELRIQPLSPSADPFELDPAKVAPLASILRECLILLRERAGDPAYNLIWWTMSRASRGAPFAGWCIRIVPRTVPGGGFEKASGVSILSSTPEADAARLRGEVTHS